MTTPSSTKALPTGTWALDPSATQVTVTAQKLRFITVDAALAVSDGIIEFDANGNIASVTVVVDSASYTSGTGKRDTHVRSADFLDAEAHPTITFETKRVTPRSGGSFESTGMVTLKGQESPISVVANNVVFDDAAASFNVSATVDRNALGVTKFPAWFIANTLTLTVSATASRSS